MSRAKSGTAKVAMAHPLETRSKPSTSNPQGTSGNTPLGVARVASSLLDEQRSRLNSAFAAGTLSRGDLRRFLTGSTSAATVLDDNLRRLAELVDEFHHCSVDPRTEVRHTISLLRFVQDVIASLGPQLQQAHVEFTVQGDGTLEDLTYPFAIRRLLAALAENAVTHAFADQPQPQISVTVTAGDGICELTFADNGCGIPLESRDRVFEPFFTTSRIRGGTGLGGLFGLQPCARSARRRHWHRSGDTARLQGSGPLAPAQNGEPMSAADPHHWDQTPLFSDEDSGVLPNVLSRPRPNSADRGALAVAEPWAVLVCDDHQAVHQIIGLALHGLMVAGRPVQILSALSAAEGRRMVQARADIAVMLVDVVMETDDAGLLLVDYVRETLDNRDVRILLNAGQPGAAPEDVVMTEREVNGYLSKAELSSQRLRTAVMGAIRSYHDLIMIRRQADLLESITQMQGRYIDHAPEAAVAATMLDDLLRAFAGIDGMLVTRRTGRVDLQVLAATGPLQGLTAQALVTSDVERQLAELETRGDREIQARHLDAKMLGLRADASQQLLLPLYVGGKTSGAAWLALARNVVPTPPAAVASLAQAAGGLLAALDNRLQQQIAKKNTETAYEWLYAVTAHLPDGVLVEESRGQIKLVNPPFCAMFEIPASPESLVGLDCALAASAAAETFVDSSGFGPRVRQILAARQPVHAELLQTVDGRWLERDFVPFVIDGEQASLWRYHDVTTTRQEHEAILANELRYSSLFGAASDAILILNEDQGIIDANSGAAAMFGWSKADMVGQPVVHLMAGHPRDARPGFTRLAHGQTSLFEQEFRRSDGSTFHAELATNAVDMAGKTWIQAVLRDVSERHRQQATLVAAKQAAESANAAKSQFLAVMSHEIRTPLNAIQGATELLNATELGSNQRELATILADGSEALLTLVNDLLDLTRIELGQLDFTVAPFDLATVLEHAVDIVRVRAYARGLSLTCEIDGELPNRVIGDAGRIRQVVMNLLGNAVNFTEVGEVSLILRVRSKTPDQVSIEILVTDTGIGIANDKQRAVFDSFSQADNTISRRFGGSGLGLSIVRSLVQMMNGELHLTSIPHVGTTMAVQLTLETPPNTPRTSAWPGDDPPTGRILLLMAQGQLRDTIIKCLYEWGLTVITAGTATETLARLGEIDASVRCVISDESVPDMDGAEIVAAMQFVQTPKRLPILLATTPPMNDSLSQNVIPLAKPLHRGRLRQGLAQALGLRLQTGTLPAPVLPERTAISPGRILIAEDNRENALLLRHTLKDAGYLVDEVSDGEQAVAAVLATPYNLVLMDVEMPLLHGMAATQRIRDWERTHDRPSTPIIAVTAHAVRGMRERCLLAGMSDYISKPLRRERVLELVGNWMDPRPLVLVADDDHATRFVVRNWFKTEKGLRSLFVGNGQEALDAFACNPVALVVLDMEMPILDGYETAARLRQITNSRQVPIIASTGHSGRAEMDRCREAGCTGFLSKPYTCETMMQTLRTHLGSALAAPRFSTPNFSVAGQTPQMAGAGAIASAITAPLVPTPSPTAVVPQPWSPAPMSDGLEPMALLPSDIDADIADLVPEFLRVQREAVQRISDGAQSRDFLQVALLGHHLRSVSDRMGFRPLVQVGAAIEQAAHDEDEEALQRAIGKLEFLLTTTQADEKTA